MSKKYTIRNKIIISFISILVFALSICGFYSINLYYNILKSDTYSNLNLTINNVENVITSNLNSLNNIASTFLTNKYINDWIKDKYDFSSLDSKNHSDLAKLENEIASNLMFNDLWTNKYIDAAYIFTDDRCIKLVSRLKADNSKAESIYSDVYKQTKDLNLGSYYILQDSKCYFVKKISNINYTKKLTLIIMLDQDNFSGILKKLPEYYSASIQNTEGKILFSNNESLIGKNNFYNKDSFIKNNSLKNSYQSDLDGKPYLIVYRQLQNPNFYITVSIPKYILIKDLINPIVSYLSFVATFIIIITIIAYSIASKYTKFIPVIVNNLNQIRGGNYSTRIPAYKDMDLNMISTTFNQMTEEFQEMINKVYKSELLLKETELKLLQSQMNPHFLINTLTTISTKALLSNDTEIYEMVNALTNLLGVTLYNNKNTFIKIADELEYINQYLFIQHIRFQDKLTYSISVENDELLECYLPKLSVEPIVENAVIHGLEDTITGGVISINIRLDSNENIIFKIEDNGKGFNVNEQLNKNTTKKAHNIGINNTNKRLKLIYGEEYGIKFISEEGNGTIAFIKIPQRTYLDYKEEDIDDKCTDC